MSLPAGLGATYRLQLHPGFGFDAAARAVPYLARLGVETLYLSPIAEAVPGSMHGYDGTDPTSIRAELGGEPAYDALVASCEEHGLGICVDHVPNHLSTWPEGPWWRRLLAEGRDGPMGEVFDVDWDRGPPGARGKVALPLLDRPLPEALAAGALRLGVRGGEAVLEVGAVVLPLAAGTLEGRGGEATELQEVLAAQHYRLVDWHDAGDRNYRRFFDIDGLVGVRVELAPVFEATHALVVRLATDGKLSALRVDHVDGLREPAAYLRRLRDETGVPVLVEKILTKDEVLPGDWPVAGTTGYETIDDVAGVLVDAHGQERLAEAGRADGDLPVEHLTVETRRLVARTSFPAEVARCAARLGVAEGALREVAVRLPRYRTYLGAPGTSDEDGEREPWREAARLAAQDARGAPPGDEGAGAPEDAVAAVLDPSRRDAALGLQQLTGALMAKGVEDTAWYRLSGPLAFCEVGGDPGRRRVDAPTRWHARAATRVARGSLGLVPGSTHDTKRAQDVRCRLYALSEMTDAFERGLEALRGALGAGPDLRAETRVVAQLALGVVPPSLCTSDGAARGTGDAASPLDAVAARLAAALEKGAREAKRRSSWRSPDAGYEAVLRGFAEAVLADDAALLRSCFGPVLSEAARLGAVNSLSATVLRHASPGVPDCFQGDEAWNLSLVDPDNRRPVDLAALARQLDDLDAPGSGDLAAALRRSWWDGRVKQLVTAGCLRARHGPGALALAPGAAYHPLAADGPAQGSLLAFARSGHRDDGGDVAWAVAVVTRLAGRLAADGDDLPTGAAYAGTTIPLPDGCPAELTDALRGARVRAGARGLEVDQVLGSLPVALLVAGRA